MEKPQKVLFFYVICRYETFDEFNVIIVQPVVVLNMNTEVFRIYDMNMNTLYKLGDLKYNGKYFLSKCGASLAIGRTCPDLSGRTCP